MKFFYSIICICLFFSTSIFSQSWNLIWSDEFNGNNLDSTKWIHDIGTGSQYGLYGWGNSELQYYQPQNTILNNGTVKIIANLEPNGIVDSWNNTMYYSSSKITTKGTFDFRYGKVEASIKTVDGQGFWPAFWMLPNGGSWPCDGEIDIMEQWGGNGPSNTTTGAAHAGTCPGGSTYQSSSHVLSNGSYADNFHIYSIEWQPDLITWYVDNIQFLQVTPSSYPNISWPFNSNNWYLMFNLAITSSGPDSNTVFPSQIEIDWVRIYENSGGVSGCTDSLAQNYNSNATNDNGLCEYLVSFEVNLNCASNISVPSVVYISSPAVNWDCNTYALNDSNSDGIWTGNFVLLNGFFDYIYCTDGWTDSESSALISAMQNGASCAPITDFSSYANRVINITSDTNITNVWGSCSLCIGGCTSPTATNYNSNADYDDGSCFTPLGCTDSLATNYDPLATTDDGTCIYLSLCNADAPIGLFASNIIHNRATINWDNMNSPVCNVDQYRIRYREIGTSSWSQKTMSGPVGSCNFASQKTDKLILNLTANKTYEYQMKAWYCGGGASSWSGIETFTTLDNCPNVGNLSVYGATPTKATFTWDASNGVYSFVRLKARVDSISNPTGADFFQIGGAGVAYGTFTKNKNGLTPSQTYRGQARTYCDPNGGGWKSLSWTPLVYWTQPSLRIEGGEAISHLAIYPNPSKDVFNITFTSERVQDLRVRVLNVVGEEIVKEELQQYIGEYTKQINLEDNAKGIYFLEIETKDGIINKKLVLQ